MSTTLETLISAIDDLLPQTQCGLCGYGGCRPYAEAIAKEQAQINLCPPGGTKTLTALANLLNKELEPFLEEMSHKEKPSSIAVIREAECIGCTKCIQACPVDAILGSAKRMHTVITAECTGCELCVEPCPVDCIDMIFIETPSDEQRTEKAFQARERYLARKERVQENSLKKNFRLEIQLREAAIETRKQELQQAIIRAAMKKSKT